MRCIEEDTDTTTCRFEFREIGPNYAGLFRPNVFEMTREEVIEVISKNNQSYTIVENDGLLLTGSLDPNLVYKASNHPHIVDATMHHFNGIQRGDFHPTLNNLINPNSHGKNKSKSGNHSKNKSIDVLGQVKNTFKSDSDAKNKIDVLGKVNNTFRTPKGHESDHASSHASKSDDDSETHRARPVLTQPTDKATKTSDMSMHGRGIRSPLDQFIIRSWLAFTAPLLGNLCISYTNMGFYLTIVTSIVITLSFLAINYETITGNK